MFDRILLFTSKVSLFCLNILVNTTHLLVYLNTTGMPCLRRIWSCPYRDSNLGPSSQEYIRYIDCANPGTLYRR